MAVGSNPTVPVKPPSEHGAVPNKHAVDSNHAGPNAVRVGIERDPLCVRRIASERLI